MSFIKTETGKMINPSLIKEFKVEREIESNSDRKIFMYSYVVMADDIVISRFHAKDASEESMQKAHAEAESYLAKLSTELNGGAKE